MGHCIHVETDDFMRSDEVEWLFSWKLTSCIVNKINSR